MPVLRTTTLQTDARSNLSDIDVFRGIAALIVAAFHTREITWVGMREFWHMHGLQAVPNVIFGYLTFPLMWGAIGVPIFFVISGYCIHRGQAFARARSASYQLSISNFLMRRMFRIYPVLFGALLVTLLCDSLSRNYTPNSYKLSDTAVGLFLVNLASLQGVAGRTYGSNVAMWTLSIEVQFYILYPLLLLVMARLGSLATFWILAVINIISYFLLERAGYQLFLSYYVSWYLGVMVAEYIARSECLSVIKFSATLYLVAICLLIVGCTLFLLNAYAAFQVWALSFAVFLAVFLNRSKEIVGWGAKFFRWLGTFSFSLYITHLPIVVLVHSVFFNSVHQVSLAPFCVTLTVAIVFAYAFSFVFERPALAMSQLWKGKRRVGYAGSSVATAAQAGSE